MQGIDYLVSSTGSKIHLDSLSFLNELRQTHPVEEVRGLPCVTGDLQWNEQVPLFVLGAYSMLEVRSFTLSPFLIKLIPVCCVAWTGRFEFEWYSNGSGKGRFSFGTIGSVRDEEEKGIGGGGEGEREDEEGGQEIQEWWRRKLLPRIGRSRDLRREDRL